MAIKGSFRPDNCILRLFLLHDCHIDGRRPADAHVRLQGHKIRIVGVFAATVEDDGSTFWGVFFSFCRQTHCL